MSRSNRLSPSTANNTTTTNQAVGSLSPFALGSGPTGIVLFEIDSAGDVFAVPFIGGGAPQFVNTELHLALAALQDGELLALLASANGHDYLIDIIYPFLPRVEPAVLAAPGL